MMTLTTAVSRVASRLNKSANDTTVYNRIKNHINDVCQEKWQAYAWSFRYREYPLVLTARVTSGTLTATNGSQTVTASGTPFDSSAHVGAWLRFTGDTAQAWYRVQTVNSSSSVTIAPAYQGTSGGSKAYELVKTDYTLATELGDAASINVTFNGHPLSLSHQLPMERCDFPPLGSGAPDYAYILNQDRTRRSYTTGTLSGTLNTTTLTGVGTAWLSNVKEGDWVVINGDTNVYYVYKVDSDTQITLYNNLVNTASGTTYAIYSQYAKTLRVHPASDIAYVVFVKGLRNYVPLVNTADTNELLDRYPAAVIEGAVWREASSSPDPREDSLYQKSELMWAKAQGEDEALFPAYNPHPIWNPRG